MIFLSTVLACLLIGSGLSAVFIGSGMIVLERGWSMVISGSIVATGGVLLLGIVMVIRELRRLPDRLADVLPETLSSQLLYAAGEAAAHEEGPADAFSPLRPRIDHGATPQWPDDDASSPATAARADFLDANPLPDLYAAPERPAPAPEASSPPAREGAVPTNDTEDAPLFSPPQRIIPADNPKPARAEATADLAASMPRIGEADRPVGGDGGKAARSLWSRLGRGGKSAAEPSLPPPVLVDDDTLKSESPPEPTTAELARQRLALADTPETDNRAADKAAPDAIAITTAEPEAAAQPKSDTGAISNAPVAKAQLDSKPLDESEDKPSLDTSRVQPAADAKIRQDKDQPEAPKANATATGEDANAPDGNETAPTVIGSYRSGANLFIMYQDGTIEAETPTGIFRFGSLDDLKAYIASGEDPALAGPRVERPRTTTEPDATAPDGARSRT